MSDTYTVTLTPGALADLDRLDTFLREKNPAAANRMLAAFNTAFAHLAENPFDSATLPSTSLRAKIVRFGKGGYVCVYRLQEQSVTIARLFHAREDWQHQV